MSDAAKVFWGAVIRHVLTMACTALIAHGYVSQNGAQAYIEELVGVVLNIAVMAWGQRVHYLHLIAALVARSIPAAASGQTVNNFIADLKANDALPSVFTPADVTPQVVNKEPEK